MIFQNQIKMNRLLVSLLFISILYSCSQKKSDEGFISRLHTPNEDIDWYKILGPTNIDKLFKDFDGIDWESDFLEADKSEVFNNTDLEVYDPLHNTYFAVSTFPWKEDEFQFEIFLGSRSITDKTGKIIEQGYVRAFLLDSNDPKRVKELMYYLFDRDYDKLFEEILKLEAIFETEDVFQNIE